MWWLTGKYLKSSWQNYYVALELKKKDATVQVATLKAGMGKECFQICENLLLSVMRSAMILMPYSQC